MSPPLRAVFLDIGGTLLHEVPPREAIYAEVAAELGRSIEPAAMRRRMAAAHHALGRTHRGAFRYSDPWFEAFIAHVFGAEGLGLGDAEVTHATTALFARFEARETFRLYPGARELLAGLRGAGLRLGVISNWSARLPRVLAALELEDSFDVVLSSAIEGLEKPDPRLFERALARLDVPAESALHAGDDPEKDVGGALGAGLRAVLVDHSGRLAGAPHAAPRVQDLGALARLVRAETR